MAQTYWNRKLSRRRALKGIAFTGAASAAFVLAGCGRGSDAEAPVKDNTGLISRPVDTTGQAKRGGIHGYFNAFDETNLDPMTTARGAGQGGFEKPGYQKLIREKETVGGSKTQVFEGDAAESYELSNDGLTLTARIRPNNRFDPRPPTNGRAMTAQDVAYSWNRLEAQSTYASVLSYKRSQGAAPIESVTATDNRTVVYKMAFPWAALIAGLAEGGPHQIVPIEAEDKFNLKNTIRGSGAWMLDYEPSITFRWRRNPGYYRSDAPFIDGFDQPILPEYATQISQFRAKHIDDFQPTNQGDVPGMLKDSGANVYQDAVGINHLHMYFSGRPTTPFRDVRLRRAASMALDRALYAEALSEAKTLRSFGLPPEIVINNNIPGGAPDFWLDPFGQEMGDAAQYFKFSPAEAKKLMAAAGYTGASLLARPSTQSHGAGKQSEVAIQMLTEVGFKIRIEPADYQTIYLPKILSSRGDWEGDISFSGGGMGFSPATGMQRVWHPQGGTTRVSCFGKPCDDDHAKITDMIDKALKEIDANSYRSQISELQRAMGMYQGAIIIDYQTGPFRLVQPWVQNWDVWRLARGNGQDTLNPVRLMHTWIDESKRT